MDSQIFMNLEYESPAKMSTVNFHLCDEEDSLDMINGIKQEPSDEIMIDYRDILSSLQQILDLRTTPLEEIMNAIMCLFMDLTAKDLEIMRKLVIRRKNVLKRSHAKQRPENQDSKSYYVITDNSDHSAREDLNNQIKKKRNRISAQISRDRRKIMVEQLQTSNQRLQQESEAMRLENERLKKQLADINSRQREEEIGKTQKNKFLSLLIMFGIFFLVSLLRDSKNSSTGLLGPKDQLVNPVKDSIYHSYSQAKLLENSQKVFIELQHSPEESVLNDEELLSNVIGKLEALKIRNPDAPIPKQISETLQEVAKQHL